MEIQELRVFQAVAEERGFGRAAERLFISQSAVSQSVSNLERKLGLRLLERSTPPQATEAGERILRYARLVLKEQAAVLEDIENVKNGLFATLSVAVNNFIARRHCPALLAEFIEAMPLCRLAIEAMPSREMIHAVESERWELGFGPFQHSMLLCETLPLYEENRLLVASARHQHIDELRRRPLAALRRLPLITSYLDPADRRPAGEKLRTKFRSVWEVGHSALRLNLVAAGHGVCYVEEDTLQEEDNAARFVHIGNVGFGVIHRQIGLYYKKGRYLSEAARLFIALCRRRWPQ